jgi:hypothetical protein
VLKETLPRRGSRAAQPGSPGPFRPAARYVWLAVLAVLVAVIAVPVGLYLTRSPGGAPAVSRYGGLPTWLPTAAVPVGRVATASPAHPWLAVEGDSVRVELPHGQALATAVGPAVPEEGQFPVPATTPCTFTLTLTGTSGTIPLRPAAFTIRDEQGQLHYPKVTAPGGRPLPASAAPGTAVTLTISAVLPTGNGQLQWAPQGGGPVVSWDFDVEID